MSRQPPPAPTASTIGPCPTFIQISRPPRHWKFPQDHRPPLWENPKPYMFRTLDYKAFSPEARLLHFLGSFQEEQTTVNTGSLEQRQRPEMLSRCCVILSVTGNGIGDYVLNSPDSTPYFNSAARASHFE